MEQITLKKSGFQIPDIAVGCMRINEMSENDLKYMESEVARKIKELKNKYLQIN